MKKTTMTTIANYIKNVPELTNEYTELAAELNKSAEKAAANRSLYETAKATVIKYIPTTKTITVTELYGMCSHELPKGFTKSKMQYALNNYWTDVIVKISNPKAPNEYKRA